MPVGYHRSEHFMRHDPVMQGGRGPRKSIGSDNHENSCRQKGQKQANRAERNARRAETNPEPAPRGKPFHNKVTFDMVTLPLGLLARDFTKSLQNFSPDMLRHKFSQTGHPD